MALAFLLFFIGQQHIINPMATDAAWRLHGRPLTFLNTMVYGKSHSNKISGFLIQLLQYHSEKKQQNCKRKRLMCKINIPPNDNSIREDCKGSLKHTSEGRSEGLQLNGRQNHHFLMRTLNGWNHSCWWRRLIIDAARQPQGGWQEVISEHNIGICQTT